MLSNNFPTTFLVEESDFLPVSGLSGLNVRLHSIHSLLEDWCYFIKRLEHSVYKEISEQIFINKI